VGQTPPAVIALAAGDEEGYHYRVSGLNCSDAFAYFFHVTGRFVPEDARGFHGQFTAHSMDIAVTDGRGRQLNFYFAFPWRVDIYFFDNERFAQFITDSSFHFSLLMIYHGLKFIYTSLIADTKDCQIAKCDCEIRGGIMIK
jgi:hypothetical protein